MKKICKRCNLQINPKDKGVTWITFENGEDIEKIHWHWKCFIEWRNESMETRAIQIYSDTMKKILPSNLVEHLVNNAKQSSAQSYL